MVAVFQRNVFQNNVFQVGDAAATVGTVGGSRKHHAPGGPHFPRREFDRLLEEQAAERRAILAKLQAERDEKARLKLQAQAKRIAKIEAKAEAAEAERLAERSQATAEQAKLFAIEQAKREAELLALALEIERQEDEDDVLMMAIAA
jgi:hypothetical protein